VTGHSDGLFVYLPDRPGRPPSRIECWANERRGCLQSTEFGYPAGSIIVAAPDGETLYIDGNGGVLTVHVLRRGLEQ
jgi:hypothetical protein